MITSETHELIRKYVVDSKDINFKIRFIDSFIANGDGRTEELVELFSSTYSTTISEFKDLDNEIISDVCLRIVDVLLDKCEYPEHSINDIVTGVYGELKSKYDSVLVEFVSNYLATLLSHLD